MLYVLCSYEISRVHEVCTYTWKFLLDKTFLSSLATSVLHFGGINFRQNGKGRHNILYANINRGQNYFLLVKNAYVSVALKCGVIILVLLVIIIASNL